MNACTWAIVPIRSFASGKRRLASVLNPDQRAHLCVAMALRVVRTLRAHPGLADVAVVSPDAAVRAWSAQHASVVLDETGLGLNAALDHAARTLQRLGASSLLIIPADVPALTTADVSALLDASEDVVIAPAARDGGTNALRLSLPLRLAFKFGADSAAVHLAAARSAGASVNLLPLRSLARDIDVVEDLVEAIQRTDRNLRAEDSQTPTRHSRESGNPVPPYTRRPGSASETGFPPSRE